MFKWPGTPSAHAPEHELADFAELVCWQHRSTSTTAPCADLGRLEVFGTSAGLSDFREKADRLCQRLREGEGFLNRDRAEPTQRDGQLDVVVWKPFADGDPGKLIAFGQCKTGTDHKDTVTQLQPDSFCRKWLHSSPVLT